MKRITIGSTVIGEDEPGYFIAEIGHNHQGDPKIAEKMIRVAAGCGVQAVKLQKRDNRTLFTRAAFNRPYDNENSYGDTYGAHREYLEFGVNQYRYLKGVANNCNVEFFATAFDQPSVDFLEGIGVNLYKVASGDITNTPLLTYIAQLGKPMIVSTGASTLEEIRRAYDTILGLNDKLVLLHCVAGYPVEYEDLNLRMIETLRREFPDALIGYSGHDKGILATSIAYLLGARVFEKHFTLDRSAKGTDHGFSLEPEGLRRSVRDLYRTRVSLGDGKKVIKEFEFDARRKMGKSIYAARDLPAGCVLTIDDLALKTPADGLPPYYLEKVIGQTLEVSRAEEELILLEHLSNAKAEVG